jgi:hypothetical protein
VITEAIGVKDRPILFRGPMVKAILDGRKTQTRRVIKPQPPSVEEVLKLSGSGYKWMACSDWGKPAQFRPVGPVWAVRQIAPEPLMHICPYGAPCDRLWVRESLRRGAANEWHYSADDLVVTVPSRDKEAVSALRVWAHHKEGDSCPSIHMPRWASRITLEVTKVRVERVKDCSEADARAEGPEPNWSGPLNEGPAGTITEAGWDAERDGYMDIEDQHYPEGCECGNGLTGREAFEKRWNAINAGRGFGWEKNPWVWVIEFKRVAVSA